LSGAVPARLGQEVAAGWLEAMRAGDWEAAWRQTDRIELPRRVLQRQPGFVRDASHLVWDGAAFDSRRVRVRCLHGLGDTLQFMRFVPRVAARARHVDFLVQPMLLELLRDAPGLGLVSNGWTDDPPPCDVEIEVMELAYAMRCRVDTLPPPYPLLAHQVRKRVIPLPPRDGRLRVGVLWSVSDWGASRSVPLRALAPLLRLPHFAFYSLQQGKAAHDPDVERFGLTALSPHTQEIADAAAAMLQMDFIVTPDAMPAHLAGTLGRPTWVMLQHEADWRWMRSREDTPWYPTVRLFRQPAPGDWDGVVQSLAESLAEELSRPRASTGC
jgi:hypothetical protein